MLEIEGRPYPWWLTASDDALRLRLDIGKAQERTNRKPGAKGSGNRTKRVEIGLRLKAAISAPELEAWISSEVPPHRAASGSPSSEQGRVHSETALTRRVVVPESIDSSLLAKFAREVIYWVYDGRRGAFSPISLVRLTGSASVTTFSTVDERPGISDPPDRTALEAFAEAIFAHNVPLSHLLGSWLRARSADPNIVIPRPEKWLFLSSTNEGHAIWTMENVETLVAPTPSTSRSHLPKNDQTIHRVNWEMQDVQNRALGSEGEEFVADFERRSLIAANRPDLACLVDIRSISHGDGLGYDVFSFTALGEEKYIEVKTTAGRKDAAFLITANELRSSNILGGRYWVYRVFGPRERRRLYMIQGP
jgi:hypothetical protein